MLRVVWWSLFLTIVVGLARGSAQQLTSANEWTRFRGPNGSGIGVATDLPVTWTEKDFLWKVSLPGKGNSSPVLWGEKIFLTAGDNKTGKRIALCVHADSGKLLWRRDFDSATYKLHQRNGIATATPTVDARHVYLAWATPAKYTVMALDHEGKTVWEKDLGPYKSQHGFGVSPIVHEDLLILPSDQDGGGSLFALDTATGKTRWQVPRKSGNATYATPCVYQAGNRPAEIVFTNWQHGITAVDPRSGKVTWEISTFEPTMPERSIASPIMVGDMVLGTCGFVTAQKHHVAVRPTDNGKAKEIWRVEKAVSYLGTPLVKGRWVFLFSEKGIGTCLEASTGKVLWQERLDGNFSSSAVCAGEHIYCPADNGEVVVIAAKDTYRLLARNPLGEATQATPAIARGRLFFRTSGHLLCIGKSK
jgi:outer membrane protein assembly factor BamB